MKNDKLLLALRTIKAGLLNGKEPSAYIYLQNLITEVEGEIRDECNKDAGRSSVAKAAERILKTASRDSLRKAYRGKKGLIVCDGFRAVRFNPDTAPSLVEHPEKYTDYPDIDHIIDGLKRNDIPVILTRDVVELRAYIKAEKARLKAKRQKGVRLVLTDGEGLEIHVDAEYLLDMLEALPGATVTASGQKTGINYLYFKAENGDGILSPLRPPKN